jgi:predicted MFS family arabinose efflux permease
VAVRSALGLAGPAFGSAADSWGRKVGLSVGLVLFIAGLLPVAIWPTYQVLLVGLVLSGVGNIIVDSSIYAFIGDRFPYQRRSRAIALVEIGWSAAYLIGIPAVGWLMANQGWNAPFLWLALFGGVALVWNLRLMPADRPLREHRPHPWQGIGRVLREPSARAGLLFSLLLVAANQLISIIYGAWMESTYHLQVEELGVATTVLGLAGIVGVLLVIWLADRLGKVRAIGLGIGGGVLACLTLPWLGQSLTGALAVLFVLYFSFEFALTSSLSLMTELVPAARATMMAGTAAAMAAGDSLGAFFGLRLYEAGGIFASTGIAALVGVLSLALLVFYVKVDRATPVRERSQI